MSKYAASAAKENREGVGGSLGELSDCDTSLTPGKEERGGRKVEWKHSRVFGKAVIEFMSQRYLSGKFSSPRNRLALVSLPCSVTD